MVRRIFHLDMDAFFVAVERVRDPSLEGKPVAVGGEPGTRGVVACASYEARAYGLHAGMPLKTAYRLCPQAIYLPGRYAHYLETSRRFLGILQEYTPFIEPLGMDEAFLDMTGFDALYGPPSHVAREIKARIRGELGITASAGIASSKVAAKVASDYGKPDGLLEVAPGEDAPFLAPLAVDKLPGVGQKVAAALSRLGIETVGQLAALPPFTLRRVFGVWGDLLHLWANGKDHAPVTAPAPPKSISRETTFAEDQRDIGFLLATLRYLGERVTAELRREGKRARRVVAKVRYADFHTISRHRTLPAPSDQDDVVFRTGTALLRQAMGERQLPIRLIGIGVADLVDRGTQLPLMEDEAVHQERLCHALDSLRDKYGFTALQTGRTFQLGDTFPSDERGYVLKTPSLSR